MTDTAILAGAFNPPGTIIFRLYGPGDTACAGPTVFSDNQPAGAGPITSASFTPTASGIYRWIASYSGHSHYAAKTGALFAAAAELGRGESEAWFLLTVASPFYSQAFERYLRAELLDTLGRGDEAHGWRASIAERSPYEILYGNVY